MYLFRKDVSKGNRLNNYGFKQNIGSASKYRMLICTIIKILVLKKLLYIFFNSFKFLNWNKFTFRASICRTFKFTFTKHIKYRKYLLPRCLQYKYLYKTRCPGSTIPCKFFVLYIYESLFRRLIRCRMNSQFVHYVDIIGRYSSKYYLCQSSSAQNPCHYQQIINVSPGLNQLNCLTSRNKKTCQSSAE